MTVSARSLELLSQIPETQKVVRQVAEILANQEKLPSYELELRVGCSKHSITKALRHLRDRGWVYICSWTHPGGSNILAPVYGWKGLRRKADAAKPPRKPKSEINRDWNERNKVYRAAMQRAKRGTKPSIWQGLMK